MQLHQKHFLGNLSLLCPHMLSLSQPEFCSSYKLLTQELIQAQLLLFQGWRRELWNASAWLSEYLSSSPAYIY